MEQTKTLPPLVSDEYLSSLTPISEDWKDGPCTPVTPTEVRNIYEAERRRTREVVQALVNGINDARFALFGCGKVELANTLAEIEILAKSQLQIEPTKR